MENTVQKLDAKAFVSILIDETKLESAKVYKEKYSFFETVNVIDCIKQARTIRKQQKEQELRKTFVSEHCIFKFKGHEFTVNPKYMVSEDGSKVILFAGLDKNAYVIVEEKDGNPVVKCIPTVSTSNKKYDWSKALVTGNAAKVRNLFKDALQGVTYESFLKVCSGYKNFNERKQTGSLKEYMESRKNTKKAK